MRNFKVPSPFYPSSRHPINPGTKFMYSALGLINPEDGGSTLLRKVGDYLEVDAIQYSTRFCSPSPL